MSSQQLETDERGNVILKPVKGWTTRSLAGMAILLAIDYAENPAEIESGGKSIQLALTVPQCIELAQALSRGANAILGMSSPDRPN